MLAGGAGSDAAGFYDSGVSGPVIVDLSVGTASNAVLWNDRFALTAARQSTVENVSGGPGDDQLTGDDRANSLDGRQGGDLLSGGEGNDNLVGGLGVDAIVGGRGNDTIQPGAGADTADGGFGVDTLKYKGVGAGVTANLTTSTSSEDASIAEFENLSGSAFDDTLTGDSGPNVLKGNGGNDTLNSFDGFAGNDEVNGGANGVPGDSCEFDTGDTVIGCENNTPH